MRLVNYVDRKGHDRFQEWFDGLRDRTARVAITRRLDRLVDGHTGDCKFCRDGVWELRIDVGAGYRVYYARAEQTVVLLLCGGDKRTQDANITRAVAGWQDYQRRHDEDTTPSQP